MFTQSILGSMRRWRSWIALAAVGMLVLVVLVVQALRPALAQDGTVLKVYPCPAGQASLIADHLRETLSAVEGVRVAADVRSSQVVVQAPREVQAWVAQQLAVRGESKAVADARAAANTTVQTRTVTLQRSTPRQIETALGNLLGDRLTTLTSPRDAVREYRLTADGESLNLSIDPASSQVKISGPASLVDSTARVVQVLDGPVEGGRSVRLLPLRTAHLDDVQRATTAIQTVSNSGPDNRSTLAYYQAKPPENAAAAPGTSTAVGPGGAVPPVQALPSGPATGEGGARGGLINPVQIESIPGIDVLVVRGNPQDVAQVVAIIQEVERLAALTKPEITTIPLHYVDCLALAGVIAEIYENVYRARQGSVSITPLITPNELLVVGRKENVATVVELVQKLDKPSAPNAQFRVFQLRYISAATAQTTVSSFFTSRGQLSPYVAATADTRSNSLIVQASPRDMLEVEKLLGDLDVSNRAQLSEVRIIRLEHALASDVAAIMQSAISAATGGPTLQQGGVSAQPQQPPAAAGAAAQRAEMVRFLTIDARGRRLLNSAILSDVKITTDPKANALIVTAPPEDMELLETLIRQIDLIPAANAEIKVFTVHNGDATSLSQMLSQLFGLPTTGGGGAAGALQQIIQVTSAGGENTVIPLHFAVDVRTNSVVASGTAGDLNVVEAVLTTLDSGDVRNRRTIVMKLKNSPVANVANTVNTYIQDQLTYDARTPGLTSMYEEFEREVLVVPETVTNSIVLSATPRFFDEIKGIIESLDARPLMVTVDVLIASVELENTDEFGIELGLQDSALFDRSLLSNPVTTSTTLPNGTTTQTVIAANNQPGLNFNDTTDALGNSGLGTNLSPKTVAGQSLTNFGVGRQDSSLGYGGLVLSLQSENISALIRALAENHKTEVLQRPQITMLDNQAGNVQVGQRVPTISSVSVNALTGQSNAVTFQNVGVLLGITPRISPDGMVVMLVDAEKSALEAIDSGIPIYSSPTGQVIRSPIIDSTVAQTTISAMDGQTIVLAGLITKDKTESHRSVPWLGDIPVLGNLFRYDTSSNDRTELLIILTPHIIHNPADAEAIKRDEAAKMSWCLCDVTKIYGEAGLTQRGGAWGGGDVKVVFPDAPDQVLPGEHPAPEAVPAPQGAPGAPAAMPHPTDQPMAPTSGPIAPSPGDPIPGVQSYGQPPANGQAPYPPVQPPPVVEPAYWQQPAAGPAPPYPGAPQQAVYQQPMGPAPDQPQYNR
jgi:general secretion pathway protein D